MRVLEFTAHPARRRPLALGVVLFMLAIVDYVTYTMYHDCLMAGLMSLLFMAYLASFLFPSVYRVDDRGITLMPVGMKHFFPWQRFRRYRLDRGGVFLTSFTTSRTLDAMRGVYLVMDRAQREQLRPVLEDRLGK